MSMKGMISASMMCHTYRLHKNTLQDGLTRFLCIWFVLDCNHPKTTTQYLGKHAGAEFCSLHCTNSGHFVNSQGMQKKYRLSTFSYKYYFHCIGILSPMQWKKQKGTGNADVTVWLGPRRQHQGTAIYQASQKRKPEDGGILMHMKLLSQLSEVLYVISTALTLVSSVHDSPAISDRDVHVATLLMAQLDPPLPGHR